MTETHRVTVVAAVLVMLVLWLAPSSSLAAESPGPEERAITAVLRCPVCENLSVADSPSELAELMRAVVRRKLAAGESREAILAYFADRYGDDVLLEPPKRGIAALAWIGPPLALAGLGLAFLGAARRWRRAAPGEPMPLDPADAARYAARLRRDLADES